MKILLGSNSPRRKELLKELGFDFSVVKINCEENYPEDLPVSEIAGYLSELKSSAYGNLKNDEVLLTADTIVVINETVLGKPEKEVQAREMLEKLSGKIHEVYTGITIRTLGKTITQTDVAQVEFDNLSSEEIDFYINLDSNSILFNGFILPRKTKLILWEHFSLGTNFNKLIFKVSRFYAVLKCFKIIVLNLYAEVLDLV